MAVDVVDMAETQYLKPEAIAKELDVSPSTIKRLIKSGELTGIQVGKRLYRVERSAYEQWKQAHAVGACS